MMSKSSDARLLERESWWFRIRHTPLSDVFRGALTGSLSVQVVIDNAQLPAPLPQTILRVVRRTRLWHRERIEVARELISHFQDGLSSGTSPVELATSFGDEAQAAKLIRRAKKRNRPLWWRTGVRTMQGVMLLPVLLIVLYLPIAVRFFVGSPSISHDYVAEISKPARAVPSDQRAWPLYRRALVGLPHFHTILNRDDPHPAGVKPGDPEWPAFEQFVINHADRFALIRQAAKLPGFGYVPTNLMAEENYELWPETQGNADQSDGSVISLLLPYLGEMRRLAILLVLDTRRAVADSDRATAIENYNAMTSIVRHSRENQVFIGDLVALAIAQMLFERIGELLAEQPDFFTDDQWRDLAHRISSLTDDDLRLRLSGERHMFHDILQRIYTDDGNGNGRITWQGMKLLDDLSAKGMLGDYEHDSVRIAAGPAFSLLVANRRDMLNEYERIISDMERNGNRPLWERENTHYNNLLATWEASPIDRIRWLPIVRFLPAIEHGSLQHHYVRGTRDGLLTAIALELYRRQHGEYPATLEALTPSLLPTVPRDPFDGEMMRYRIVDGRPLLYSVSTDFDDDGGTPEPEPASHPRRKWLSRETVDAYKRSSSEHLSDGDWILWPPQSARKP